MDVTILLYENMTALDAIGPYETLVHVPEVRVRFAAKKPGPVPMDSGVLSLVAEYALSDIEKTDVLLVPGGGGTRALLNDAQVLDWIRALDAHTEQTVSVCSGSLLLAAAGLLRGRRAKSHWAVRDALSMWEAVPTAERVVRDGKYITCAGVSAGIDLGLRLLAERFDDNVAMMTQLAIEYDPDPPFDAGSPERAPAALVELVRRRTTEVPSP